MFVELLKETEMEASERKEGGAGVRAEMDRIRSDRQRRIVAAVEASYLAQLSRQWRVPKPAARSL